VPALDLPAELEKLAVEMFARGLSAPDIEAAFRDADGASLLRSRTAVSQVTERLWQEYEAFATRDLSEFPVAYLFVDGLAERPHAGMPREGVLCAWGITADGRKVLLHLAPGTKEDTASGRAFFEDLRRRGLPDHSWSSPTARPALIRAVEECFPRSLRQRCLTHRMRNLRSKVPETTWPEFAARARASYEAAGHQGLARGRHPGAHRLHEVHQLRNGRILPLRSRASLCSALHRRLLLVRAGGPWCLGRPILRPTREPPLLSPQIQQGSGHPQNGGILGIDVKFPLL
jgi:hypothetical protein